MIADILAGSFAAFMVIGCITLTVYGLINLYEYFELMDSESRKAEIKFIVFVMIGAAALVLLLLIAFYKLAGGGA